MRQSINVYVLGAIIVAHLKLDKATGKVKVNDKGHHGYFANGKKDGWTIPANGLPDTIEVTIENQVITARLNRIDGWAIKFSTEEDGKTPKNCGYFANGKVKFDDTDHQVGVNITVCKCGGKAPTAGQVVTLQVGGNITKYVSEKGKAAATKKPVAVANKSVAPPVVSSPAQSEEDRLTALIARIYAS